MPRRTRRPIARVGPHPRWLTGLAAAVLAALVLVPGGASRAATESVTLAGSVQSELGCASDWDPACAESHLTADAATGVWSGTFDVPAGSYELKIAVNDGWTENYGAGGVADGPNMPLILQGDARLTFSFDESTHLLTIAAEVSGASARGDRALARSSLRSDLTRERFYFLMADRFANGDPANDLGGLTGGRLQTGFDPTDKAFYHGGDLQGLTQKLNYIKGLGTTAIWLTPSFKNRPVQGTGSDVSAGYHGYWITDFTQIDPHLGTNQDMEDLIAAAHAKGMKVFFDIITNHTADVISYQEGTYGYVSSATSPYRDANGDVFDPRDVAGSPDFPPLDPDVSFPYHPVFPSPADATVKVPAWLNDVTMYHNRGDSTFAGESSEWGDFIGLDDLFTERPEVVDGMIDIYQAWVDLGIDGFRIDTVKHVNLEFWQKFSPALLDHASQQGNDDFFMFGEVFDGNPAYLSTFTTDAKLQATLDFGFQARAVPFAQGAEPTKLADFYALDDYYTDTDSNAYQLPTFLGNHDMGRVAKMLQGASADDAELLARVRLANDLLYLTRGQPVVYYGDEQGFIGAGGDQDAREDMFATQTEQYAGEKVLAGPSGSLDRFDRTHPLYRQIRSLSHLRRGHRALANGAQLPRYADEDSGVFAFSRVARSKHPREYLVALNNSTTDATATMDVGTSRARFRPVFGTRQAIRSDAARSVTVTVPALSAVVFKASKPLDVGRSAPTVTFRTPTSHEVGGRAEIGVDLTGTGAAGLNQVSIAYRPVGTSDWTRLGTDDNAPYRVFHNVSGLAKGTVLEYRSVVRDPRGHLSATSTSAVVGNPPKPPTGGGGGVVVQPDAVSVPGTLNSEMGCAADWMPDCDQAQLALDPNDLVWKGTYSLPAGGWGYKAAINKSWAENYGAGGIADGPNIDLTTTADPVTFYYDHGTHWATSDAQVPIITAAGSFQSELGCPGDWQPDCMRPWLQDPDGDGTYTWVTTLIPAGDYEFKVAHGLSWDENYGAGGVADGANVAMSVPDGATVTFSYDVATHLVTVTTG